jgi:hypothetical protein
MFEHFYHQTIRKIVVAFGALFNDIYISRLDDNNDEVERIKVPISYGPQQKFIRRLARIGTDFDATKVRIENYLPRLSFEISNLSYDPNRKLNTMNRTVFYDQPGSSTMKTRYERVPYNMDLNLGIMTKNTEDALQIIEQILPFFQPEYTVSLKMNELDSNVNIPIVFKNCVIGEGDDGSYGGYDLRKLTYANLTFTSKFYLYGPIKSIGVITDTGGVGIHPGRGGPTGTAGGINIIIGLTGGETAANIRVYPNDGVTAGDYTPQGPTSAVVEITEYPPGPTGAT